jgi:hypothetical protein
VNHVKRFLLWPVHGGTPAWEGLELEGGEIATFDGLAGLVK